MAEYNQRTLNRFQTGHQVGKLAQTLFPGGTEVAFGDGNFEAMITQTRALIDRGEKVIYEATFSHDDVLVRADILVRNGNAWDLYEVKSSTKVKPENEHDAAIQWFVLSQYIPLGKAHIVHIDTSYVLAGELDVQRLLKAVDITEDVLQLQRGIEANLGSMAEMLEGEKPDIPIGLHCNVPYDCDFTNYCWRDVPVPSVFNLYNLKGDRKFDLYRQGLINYEDVKNLSLTPVQELQVKTALSGDPHIDSYRIGEFINSATYPINFLDFETFSSAIPKIQGQMPYRTAIPFQYSLHILHEDGSLEHKEFLGDGYYDPRTKLAEQLTRDITNSGSIVAFSQSTEKSIIKRLADEFEQYREPLLAMDDRFIDLIIPFRKLMYYHPNFNGSFSIKSILPAMFPDDESLSYKELDIQEGDLAGATYAKLEETQNEKELQKIRESLLAYCKLDTLAMVVIWQALGDLTQ